MGNSKTTPWVLGTAIAAIVIIIGTYLLGISPKLASASDESSQTEAQQARIDQLGIQLAGLKRDFANIQTFRDELSGLQVQIPSSEELSTLNRQLETIATEAGVVVTSVSASSAVAVATAAAATAGTATKDSAAAAQPSTGTATPAAQTVNGLFATPIEVILVGTYDNTLAFLDKLQTGNPRLVLVSRIEAVRQEATGAQGGMPALAAGDLQLTFTAYAFAMPDPRQPVVAPTPAPLPVPAGQPNPFLPLP